jgi:hypothetical protein
MVERTKTVPMAKVKPRFSFMLKGARGRTVTAFCNVDLRDLCVFRVMVSDLLPITERCPPLCGQPKDPGWTSADGVAQGDGATKGRAGVTMGDWCAINFLFLFSYFVLIMYLYSSTTMLERALRRTSATGRDTTTT